MLLPDIKKYAVLLSIVVSIGGIGYCVYKYTSLQSEYSVLQTANTKLISDNETLSTSLSNEKKLREDTEKVLSHFKDLSKENKETESHNTIVVEKIKQIDIKAVNADTINNLVSDLEGDWQCINGC